MLVWGVRPLFKSLSVVVPCLDEESNLEEFDSSFFPYFDQFSIEKEFIFIDDGSKDKTRSIIRGFSKRHENIITIDHDFPLGLGKSLRDAFAKASGEAIVVFDADLTFHPKDLYKLVENYKPGIDCVSGSPILGSMNDVSFFRKFLSVSVNKIYQLLLTQNISAVSSIFRVYRTSRIKEMNLVSVSFDINAEIFFQLLKKKARIVEVPVALGKRTKGRSKINFLKEIINHLKMFIKIIYWRLGFN
ncbi:MAG: glycosyltransferase family 2 protein [Elusimicrobiota bacterium]